MSSQTAKTVAEISDSKVSVVLKMFVHIGMDFPNCHSCSTKLKEGLLLIFSLKPDRDMGKGFIRKPK